ncbi:MAG: VanZ family protein [Gemmatimonadaceae bacterium]
MSPFFAHAAPLALLIVPVCIAIYAVSRLNRQPGNVGALHVVAFAAFSVYVVMLGVLTLAPPAMSSANGTFGTNLVPVLESIGCFVPNPGQPSTTAFCLQTMGGNFAMFIPLGFLVPLISEGASSVRPMLLVATGTSIAIEVLQYAGRWVGTPRWTDIDDVLFNVAGALAGYAILRAIEYVIGRLTKNHLAQSPAVSRAGPGAETLS